MAAEPDDALPSPHGLGIVVLVFESDVLLQVVLLNLRQMCVLGEGVPHPRNDATAHGPAAITIREDLRKVLFNHPDPIRHDSEEDAGERRSERTACRQGKEAKEP